MCIIEVTFQIATLQLILPWIYRKHPNRSENSNYWLPYALYSSVIAINFTVWFVFLGESSVLTLTFLFQIAMICLCVTIQTRRHNSDKDVINGNHGWMCFLALGSQALGVGIGAAFVSLIAAAETAIAQCIIWFSFAFVLSSMLQMFVKMAEWSVSKETQPIFTFAILFADDFFSELIFALVEPFGPTFFVLIIFTVVRNIIRDSGGFDYLIRYVCLCQAQFAT